MKFYYSLLLVLAFLIAGELSAQVTIGANLEPDPDALLDLKESVAGTSTKGLLLPRMELKQTILATPLTDHVEGMIVYNTIAVNDVTPGYYYNDGTKWVKLMGGTSTTTPKFFYMPANVLPTDVLDPAYDPSTETFTVDLYAVYAQQFGLTNIASSIKNPGATTLPIEENNDFEYFVTYYDNTVFSSIALSDLGVLTYKLHPTFSYSDRNFVNIVFKVK